LIGINQFDVSCYLQGQMMRFDILDDQETAFITLVTFRKLHVEHRLKLNNGTLSITFKVKWQVRLLKWLLYFSLLPYTALNRYWTLMPFYRLHPNLQYSFTPSGGSCGGGVCLVFIWFLRRQWTEHYLSLVRCGTHGKMWHSLPMLRL